MSKIKDKITKIKNKSTLFQRNSPNAPKHGVQPASSGNAGATVPENIWGSRPNEAYFRKVFSLNAPAEKAVLRIFVDTGYELHLNGRFVAGVDEWCNTRDYDVAPFLVSGKNIIAVKGMNHGGHRGLALELRIFLAGHKLVSVISDSTWLTAPEERWGWRTLGYDDARWDKARTLCLEQAGAEQWRGRPGENSSGIMPCQTGSLFFQGDIPKGVDSPFFKLKSSKIKAPREVLEIIGQEYQDNLDAFPPEIMMPAKVIEADPGNGALKDAGQILQLNSGGMKVTARAPCGGPTTTVDFGGETAGYLRLRVCSDQVVRFRLIYGEMLNDCHHPPPPESLFYKMVTEEVCLCSGVQEWESRTRQGFRFVKIEFMNCPAPVIVEGAAVKTSLYPLTYQGYFSCSDPLLNQIWTAGRRTLHLCMQEYYLDGIKRDRFLWTGDARLEALINYYAFGDRELFLFCWKKLAEVQYRDGGIPSALGEGASIIWDYVAWWIIAFGDYHLHAGDLDFPRAMQKPILRAMDWLIAKSGPDGLIAVPVNRTEGWMCVLNKKSGRDLSLNFMFYRSLQVVSKLMKDLGEPALAQHYGTLARKTKAAFNGLKGSPGVDAFAPDFDHLPSGSLEGFEVIQACFRKHCPEEGMRFIREYWGDMLRAGSDTLWEGPIKNPDLKVDEVGAAFQCLSRCHGWTAGPTCALLSEVAGIRPTAPGFKEFEIEPQLGELTFVKGVVPTPQGPVALSIERADRNYRGTVLVPAGSRAKIRLPRTVETGKFFLNGKAIGQESGFGKIKGKEYICIKINAPGKYTFDYN